jgi:hypothetical protein
MNIELEKSELMKKISDCNNPMILKQIRDVFTKYEKRKSSIINKIKKDIK